MKTTQYFPNFFSREFREVTLKEVYDIILHDERLKRKTEDYRLLMAEGTEDEVKKAKKKSPQIAVSFRMKDGKEKKNCGECLYAILVDFDAKDPDNPMPPKEMARVKEGMRSNPHTMLGYESISGQGYHAIVPFELPEGITIDMKRDSLRSEKIFKRVHRIIDNQFLVWLGYEMDTKCDNVNRLTGLSHDPKAVYRPDAIPFRLTRQQLGIDDDGKLAKLSTPKHVLDKDGNLITLPLGDHLERAKKMVEDEGISFARGSRHEFVMRVAFILNRMGVDKEEAAEALDEEYRGQMDELQGRCQRVRHMDETEDEQGDQDRDHL